MWAVSARQLFCWTHSGSGAARLALVSIGAQLHMDKQDPSPQKTMPEKCESVSPAAVPLRHWHLRFPG